MQLTYKISAILLSVIFVLSCENSKNSDPEIMNNINRAVTVKLDIEEANRLAQLPSNCIQKPLPYKAGLTISKPEDLVMPRQHHPAFYGCFDWHSAVHGHWSLVYLLKSFPELEHKKQIIKMLDENLSKENIEQELKYFSLNTYSASFERTYGWAWLLKLQEELYTWDDPNARKWYRNIEVLATYISEQYTQYLPKLVYPIRVGEHSNTAFGLSFAYDYAIALNDEKLKKSIRENAIRFYEKDKDCPITWEPSGYDFLSPCLQELDIMRKIYADDHFDTWFADFLPELYNGRMRLEPGRIIDRSDGKLVHLDGLNFSRAWCLYPLNHTEAQDIANTHLKFSLDKITDGDYAGQHWLASFALYAFKTQASSQVSFSHDSQ